MKLKNLFLAVIVCACHATPAPVAPLPKVEEPPQAQKVEAACDIHSEEDMLYSSWFSEETADQFAYEVCGDQPVLHNKVCFELFAKTFMNITHGMYPQGNVDKALSAFLTCTDKENSLSCFELFERTLLETNNEFCRNHS